MSQKGTEAIRRVGLHEIDCVAQCRVKVKRYVLSRPALTAPKFGCLSKVVGIELGGIYAISRLLL